VKPVQESLANSAVTESDAVVVHVQNTVDDSAIFSQAAMKSFGPYRWMQILANIFGFLLWIVLAVLLLLLMPGNPPYPAAIATILTIGLGLFLIQSHMARRMQKRMWDPKGLFLRPHDITVSSQGISLKSDVTELKCDWQAFLRVEETPTHLFLYIERVMAYIVPKREFATPEEASRFRTIVRANIKPSQPSV
jgi:hypothetical protein